MDRGFQTKCTIYIYICPLIFYYWYNHTSSMSKGINPGTNMQIFSHFSTSYSSISLAWSEWQGRTRFWKSLDDKNSPFTWKCTWLSTGNKNYTVVNIILECTWSLRRGDGDLYVILGLVIEFDLRFFIYFQMPMGMGQRWLYLHWTTMWYMSY